MRTASFRFAALYVALFATSAGVLGAAVFVAARSALEAQMNARVQAEIQFLRGEYRTGGLEHLVQLIGARGHGVTALDYLLQRADGRHLAGEIPALPARQGWAVVRVPDAIEADGRPERVRALVTDLGDGLLLAVGDDLGRVAEIEEAVLTAFLWTVGLAAVLGIGGGVLLSRAFLTRVDAISRTAEAIIGGDLMRRIPVRGTGDDLDRLAGTLNRMLDRIATLMESLHQVSSDVAHDLRTPLSRLFQGLDRARGHASTMAEYEAAVEAAILEAEGLLETFAALLRIAQVEGASPRAGFGAVDLTAAVESVADAYRPDAEDGGRVLLSEAASGIVVDGDQELLVQAIANLVENALRHTPRGTRIALRLRAEAEGGARLSVTDDGPGVAEADLPRLRDRFYRSERSRTTPGNGLGLSLVDAVADLHGATLELLALRPGFCAALWFPAGSVRQP